MRPRTTRSMKDLPAFWGMAPSGALGAIERRPTLGSASRYAGYDLQYLRIKHASCLRTPMGHCKEMRTWRLPRYCGIYRIPIRTQVR